MNIRERTQQIIKERFQTDIKSATTTQLYNAVSLGAMELIHDKWNDNRVKQARRRRACYLSAEFLMGRMVCNNLLNLNMLDSVAELLASCGRDIAEFEEIEDAALGNGGLGRLAAGFLDSAATLNKPLIGYGIRYKYGLFSQVFEEGRQKELPDDWQKFGDPWSVRRDDIRYKIEFKEQTVYAAAYDSPIIPYGSDCINTLRLFEAESENAFDFNLFNQQKYAAAVKEFNDAQRIHLCLYPNDDKRAGKVLRLKQEYFFTSAAIQDMLSSFEKNIGSDYTKFCDYYAIALNDTHPVLAIPELIFRLTERGADFQLATDIAKKTFAYTNHTVMAEALERWDKRLFQSVLPQIYRVIANIDKQLAKDISARGIGEKQAARMHITDNQSINMANLASYCAFAVNGVAKLHTEIIKSKVLKDWYSVYPEKFHNKTNGITPRRWLLLANPRLAELIGEKLGNEWITDLEALKQLEQYADNEEFLTRFCAIKQQNKKRLCEYIAKREGTTVNPDSIFDIQIKRLHEYKRQLLNAFSALYFYFGIKDGSVSLKTPVTMIFGAKAAPGYRRAKAVIKLINEIAALVGSDTDTRDLLKIVFVHNYNVSYAEKLVTAADISEQISTAGTEASGTGNMKFMLNGTVTLGTYDGANIEIVEHAGEQNNYIFGAKADEIERIRATYNAPDIYENDAKIKRVVDALIDGTLDDGNGEDFNELYESLINGASWHRPDHYFLLYDFNDYIRTKLSCCNDYGSMEFAAKCVMNTANSGYFSSDRTVSAYCSEIWRI